MWGSLAGRVAQNVKDHAGELRGALHDVAQVVAPPVHDDDEEDNIDDDDYEGDNMDDDDYEEDDMNDNDAEEDYTYESKQQQEYHKGYAATQVTANNTNNNNNTSKNHHYSSLGSFLHHALDEEEAQHEASQHRFVQQEQKQTQQRVEHHDDDDDDEQDERTFHPTSTATTGGASEGVVLGGTTNADSVVSSLDPPQPLLTTVLPPLSTPPDKNDNDNNNDQNDSGSLEVTTCRRCDQVQEELFQAQDQIRKLQQDAERRHMEQPQDEDNETIVQQQQQARLVEAATESLVSEHERQVKELKESFQMEQLSLERQWREERDLLLSSSSSSKQQNDELGRLLKEAQARVDAAEMEQQKALAKQEAASVQEQKRQSRLVRMAQDKLAQTQALLDERTDQVKALKAAMKELKAAMQEHHKGFTEAEEEADELHTENETLRQNLHALTVERDEWKKQIDHLESQREKMAGLQMEIKMLREERDRQVAKNVSVAVNAESSQAELESERDAALALARDLEQQLKATLADLDVAHADTGRVMRGNDNLQNALEAFQNERDAELAMIEEQRAEADQATAAAHAAAIEATHEANEARMREVQASADAAVKNTMVHVESLESQLEEYRKDNFQLRRSLDEAISRLQTSQEDIIDRVLMKNILLDWFAKTGKGKKDVLAVMASLLHFTEEEKNNIHIGDSHGALGSFVDAVAAPLPPAKSDIDHLQGDTVREKWVNFLLAEIGEDEEVDSATVQTETNGTSGR